MQHRLFVVLTFALVTAVLAACGPTRAGQEWTYSAHPDQLLIEADTRGGFVPVEWAATHIPDFRLYGDGRVLWSEKPDDGTTTVWEGRLSEQEIDALLDWIDERGFFEMDEYYTVGNAPTDLPSSCIVVMLQDRTQSVCEYYDGAPVAFDEIYERLQAGAGASNAHSFEPEIGWVTAQRIEGAEPGDGIAWPENLAPALSGIGDGTWVEGETLDFLWRTRLESGPLFFNELGNTYLLVLQIPGLMPDSPPAP